MKSIKEWMKEKGMISEEGDINASNFARFMGGTFDIDIKIKTMLKPKIIDVMQMEEEKAKKKGEDFNKVEFFKKIVAVVGAIETEMGGTKGSARGLAKDLNDMNKSDPAEQIAQEVK